MIAMYAVFCLLLVGCILEVCCGVPIFLRLSQRLNQLFIDKGYPRFFGFTALFAVVIYAVGTALMAPFVGIHEAAMQVGIISIIAVFYGLFMSWGRFAGDLVLIEGRSTKRQAEVGILFGTVFVTASWGCAILLIFATKEPLVRWLV
jgi:hypothetical protein